MLQFNNSTLKYSNDHALYLGRAAQLAYEDPGKNLENALKQELGLELIEFISGSFSTQCYVATDDEKIVIAFRGTEGLSDGFQFVADWLRNLQLIRDEAHAGGEVHSGFRAALDEVWPGLTHTLNCCRPPSLRIGDVNKLIKAKKLKPGMLSAAAKKQDYKNVWITGHSLGGALATLAASRIAVIQGREVAGVYTFGQPRVGDQEFHRVYDKLLQDRHFRVVNNNDIVTRVPPRAFGYRHVGTLRYFDVDGDLHDEPGWWDRFLDRIRGRVEDFIEFFETSDRKTDGLNDHMLVSDEREGYLDRLKSLVA